MNNYSSAITPGERNIMKHPQFCFFVRDDNKFMPNRALYLLNISSKQFIFLSIFICELLPLLHLAPVRTKLCLISVRTW